MTIPKQGDWVQLAIRGRYDDRLVGDLAVHTVDDNEARYEIGFTLASEFQGRGFAREAVRRVLNYLFNEGGAQSIRATVDRRNAPSTRLLSDLGFTRRENQGWTEEFKGETVQVDVFELATIDFSVEGT